jgi:hypothetical protein
MEKMRVAIIGQGRSGRNIPTTPKTSATLPNIIKRILIFYGFAFSAAKIDIFLRSCTLLQEAYI